jgi:protein O-GlcNAc transferase
VIPTSEASCYSEQIAHLPHCYLPNDDRRPIAAASDRAAAGLPGTGFVLCAFTAAYKITPAMFEVWMRVLAALPDSTVLWLRSVGAEARANLTREAENRGVAKQRIIFAPPVADMADHLARLSLADLILDTLPYNAHSTACDALWAGVPVLTCAGEGFAARGAASALTAIGLPELIASGLKDYEHRALQLARCPEQLSDLRLRLAANRSSAPLFDTARSCRQLEMAYFAMHERANRGELPMGFARDEDDLHGESSSSRGAPGSYR